MRPNECDIVIYVTIWFTFPTRWSPGDYLMFSESDDWIFMSDKKFTVENFKENRLDVRNINGHCTM